MQCAGTCSSAGCKGEATAGWDTLGMEAWGDRRGLDGALGRSLVAQRLTRGIWAHSLGTTLMWGTMPSSTVRRLSIVSLDRYWSRSSLSLRE